MAIPQFHFPTSTIFIFFFFFLATSRSSDSNLPFQPFDVSSSLQLTRQIFQPHLVETPNAVNYSLDAAFSVSASSFSLPLHSRSSLPLPNPYRNNYTALTLSRLAADKARADAIVAGQELLQSPVTSGVRQGSGEYFARVGLGQPPKEFYMVIDTGSDITWLQCQPCTACYHQSDPVFNPSESSTYRRLTCGSSTCAALHVRGCGTDGTCVYEVDYGDGSRTLGDLATETVSFGSTGSVPNVAVGCGHDNEGLFAGSAGLLGMGAGALSLPSQIGATSFSYCLVKRDSSAASTLDFNTAPPSDAVVAPLLTNSYAATYRYVAITGIHVGGRPVQIPESLFGISADGRGGVIVDSGTAVTRLRSEVYAAFRDTFKSMSRNLPPSDGFSLFDTCYDLSSMSTVSVPTVGLQFAGGKSLALPPENYLIPVSSDGKFCLAFAATEGSLSIIGNVQQQGTRVSYNLANKYVSFSPHKC
ncbi:protein ASPARTIC PROTEASE IN GUARD CELL 1-like [Andrographis paniculata]|uniref:protein ASPARTIC PROTEASE IN GUARD CELL 1-like n=1 Tax=Andrographis paniculata TaxID=175694 RepID=UPI0021E7C0C8|nr:protein ASPARTIC PROTEASE IN GUARD CELL 1-like [Andrographis paniculata]